MTERSIYTGKSPQVVIRAGGDVLVKGWEGDHVAAESSGIWGLEVKRKGDTIQVQIGGNGLLLVPYNSSVKVYSGRDCMLFDFNGVIAAYTGRDLQILQGNILTQASAGRAIDIDCRRAKERELKIEAGWHVRCWLREEQNVRYLVDDLGGKWQLIFGSGELLARVKAGGDVILVSEQEGINPWPERLPGKVIRPDEINHPASSDFQSTQIDTAS
jgi:hypothetical protein